MLNQMPQKDKYRALYSSVRADVLSGKLAAGTKLPSKRALAASLGVSVVTVQTAYEQLISEGYIRSEERSGYYVCKVEAVNPPQRACVPPRAPEVAAQPSYRLDFVKSAAPADIFPFSVWAKLTRKALSDCGEHLLERVPCGGDPELRLAIARYLYRARGIDAPPERIIIGAGAEYLYGIIAELLGRGSLIAVENPGYGIISKSYVRAGARCAYIPVHGDGIELGAVESSGAVGVHVSPSHQFPTGAVMPVSARARLAAYVSRADGYIIEDDYDSEFRLLGNPPESAYALNPERVIYMNTFSKSLAPSMRMGYMVLPPALYKRFISVYADSACVVPLFEQKTLALLLDGGYFERHISRLRNRFRSAREKLLSKLSQERGIKIFDSAGGPHLTVKADGAPSDEYIKEKARGEGVNLKCLSDYLLIPSAGYEKTAVLNYSGYSPDT